MTGGDVRYAVELELPSEWSRAQADMFARRILGECPQEVSADLLTIDSRGECIDQEGVAR